MNRSKLRNYDKAFKLDAVNLYLKSGRSYSQVGKELGIPVATLVGWVHSHTKNGVNAFPGKGHLLKLRSYAANWRERDILKKALGIFSSARK